MAWTVQNEFAAGTIGGVCFTCRVPLRSESPTGQEGHEKALDTGIQIDFEGFVAICESCIVEAGALIGLQRPQQVADLHESLAEITAQRDAAEAQLVVAYAAVDALRQLPAPAESVVPPEVVAASEFAALRDRAEALGVKLDNRWGAARLTAEIDAVTNAA